MKRTLVIADFISGLILLLLLYTSISKMVDYERFKDVLRASPLLKSFAGFIAWALPLTELIIALMLFIPATRLKGLYTSLALLILLTLYLVYMIKFTPHLPCNCGGVLKQLSWTQHIFFNLFFIGLSIAGIVLAKRKKNAQTPEPT
jgi:hypothetical protein